MHGIYEKLLFTGKDRLTTICGNGEQGKQSIQLQKVFVNAYHHHCIPCSLGFGFNLTSGIWYFYVVYLHPTAGIIPHSVVPTRNECGFYCDLHGVDEPVLLIKGITGQGFESDERILKTEVQEHEKNFKILRYVICESRHCN